jgi:hypothetical protein
MTYKKIVLFWGLLIVFAGIIYERGRPAEKPPRKAEDTDAFFVKLRYETSGDLVDELDGFHTGHVYNLLCNDGKVRPVKVALLDRKQRRAGVVVVQAVSKVGGDIGGRAYDTNGVGFVTLEWLKKAVRD